MFDIKKFDQWLSIIFIKSFLSTIVENMIDPLFHLACKWMGMGTPLAMFWWHVNLSKLCYMSYQHFCPHILQSEILKKIVNVFLSVIKHKRHFPGNHVSICHLLQNTQATISFHIPNERVNVTTYII